MHLLFVMLRVLKVRDSDPRLFSKTLKNYEVGGKMFLERWRGKNFAKSGTSVQVFLYWFVDRLFGGKSSQI